MRARFLFLAVHFLVSSFGRVGAYRSIPGIVLPLYTRLSNRRRGHGVQLVKEGVWAFHIEKNAPLKKPLRSRL